MSDKTTHQSCRSDEQRMLDALEDDEVREALRAFHEVPARPSCAHAARHLDGPSNTVPTSAATAPTIDQMPGRRS